MQFGAVADVIDQTQPRYPAALLQDFAVALPAHARVLYAGAGSGSALEGLLPLLGDQAEVYAVDTDPEMVRVGQQKFPTVSWHSGDAAEVLHTVQSCDLVVFADSLWWFDRVRLLAAAKRCLAPTGICAVVWNCGDVSAPGITRDIARLTGTMMLGAKGPAGPCDIASALAQSFRVVYTKALIWDQEMQCDQFVALVTARVQADPGYTAGTAAQFAEQLRTLTRTFAIDGQVRVPWCSRVFWAMGT